MPKHKSFSKQRWLDSLKSELALLDPEDNDSKHIKDLVKQAKERYLPMIKPVSKHLHDDDSVMDIGCGITCIAQHIERGKKTYLDPLLDDFKKLWPGTLPRGEFITGMAENIKHAEKSIDLIVCIKSISHMQNPELAMHEMERLIKADGTIILSVITWPSLFARLHYFTARIYPQRVLSNRLYCYTRCGIERSLKRHFIIHSSQDMDEGRWRLSREIFFVCKPLSNSND